MDEKLSAAKVNIITIQNPSPPARDVARMQKLVVSVLFGSIAAAFALAFLIELFLDQSLRRPAEVEAKLGLPLFLAIPRLGLNGSSKALRGKKVPLLKAKGATAGESAEVGLATAGKGEQGRGISQNGHKAHHMEIAPWDPRHILRPFYGALRDRLITFFEVKNLTHKPKLVAVTGCASGAGVSTVAAGLAASLSETGEGNVLLVDMNLQNGVAHQFHRGDLACGLDEVLETEKRDNALVQDRLYVASESSASEALPRALPNRFKHLVPRLKASDYDYIIFDMPPVSQTSITPRLAKFMDMVLMVIESEKTDRELVRRASSLLAETKANVGIVLNKGRNYVPRRLQQEL
jgi:Mrp family chromosome partitioning ATPase